MPIALNTTTTAKATQAGQPPSTIAQISVAMTIVMVPGRTGTMIPLRPTTYARPARTVTMTWTVRLSTMGCPPNGGGRGAGVSVHGRGGSRPSYRRGARPVSACSGQAHHLSGPGEAAAEADEQRGRAGGDAAGLAHAGDRQRDRRGRGVAGGDDV